MGVCHPRPRKDATIYLTSCNSVEYPRLLCPYDTSSGYWVQLMFGYASSRFYCLGLIRVFGLLNSVEEVTRRETMFVRAPKNCRCPW